MQFLNALCREIHQDNVKAGWWTDIATGASIVETRNRGELMILVVSELCEAADGADGDLWDDKLPDRKMFDVELADTAIRLFDMIGADGGGETTIGPIRYSNIRSELWRRDWPEQLFLIVRRIAQAMEHHRKGRKQDYLSELRSTLAAVIELARQRDIPLFDIIAEKRAFNAQREDHKIENRLKAGGKAY